MIESTSPPEPERNRVVIIGGGLAGLATAAALGSAGYATTLFEARPFLGGRATSYPVNSADEETVTIDNCQHILLRCCTNLLDFYRRLDVADRVKFYRDVTWIEPGGRVSTLRRGMLKPPLHFAESFARLRFLSWADKVAIGLGMLAVQREFRRRPGLDRMTMLQWLQEKKQTPEAIHLFWRQVLVSAINEELDRMAASHGIQVFALGFLSRGDAYEMGVPDVPLAELYSTDAWKKYPKVAIETRSPVQQVRIEGGRVSGVIVNGRTVRADHYVLAVPFERVCDLVPELPIDLSTFEHSPITGIHLWFDRPITKLPHATLLNRNMHWLFNKSEGKHVQLVVSASRDLTNMKKQEVVDFALKELVEFFPAAAKAKLERSHVVKEVRATFSAQPGLESKRPTSATAMKGLYLAGDWTRSGWPATMEGAVRSGYLAAEAIAKDAGSAERFVQAELG